MSESEQTVHISFDADVCEVFSNEGTKIAVFLFLLVDINLTKIFILSKNVVLRCNCA